MLNTDGKLPAPVICSELVNDIPAGSIEVVRSGERLLALHIKKCPAFFVLWKAGQNHVFLGGNP